MKDTETLRTLRDRIILAGIAEISRNGITGFSMRRVAASCNISCAAPYRYFENKNTFILEMLRYIRSQWELMERSVCAAYDDELKKITEVCLTFILFLKANPQFLAVIMLGNIDATDGGKKADDGRHRKAHHKLPPLQRRKCGIRRSDRDAHKGNALRHDLSHA